MAGLGKPASGFTIAALDTWDIGTPQIPADALRTAAATSGYRGCRAPDGGGPDATIGVQEAAYFPAINLTGSYSLVSTAANMLFKSTSLRTPSSAPPCHRRCWTSGRAAPGG